MYFQCTEIITEYGVYLIGISTVPWVRRQYKTKQIISTNDPYQAFDLLAFRLLILFHVFSHTVFKLLTDALDVGPTVGQNIASVTDL